MGQAQSEGVFAGWSAVKGSLGDFGTAPFNSCYCALEVHKGWAHSELPEAPWAVSCPPGLMGPLGPEWTDCDDSIRTHPISMTLSLTIPLTSELLQPQWQIIISFKKRKRKLTEYIELSWIETINNGMYQTPTSSFCNSRKKNRHIYHKVDDICGTYIKICGKSL